MVDDTDVSRPGMDAAGAPEPLPNLFTRAIQVFVAPGALFNRLKEKPVWLGALLVVLVLAGAAALLVPADVMRDAFTQNLPPDATPEAIEQAERMADIFTSPGVRLVTNLIPIPIILLIWVGVLMLVFNVFMGGDASFKQLLSFTSHSWIIPTAGTLVSVPLRAAKGEMTAGLNLGLLVPPDSGFLYRFLAGMDLFALWGLLVLAIGLTKLYAKRSIAQAATILIILYALLVAGFAAIGGPR